MFASGFHGSWRNIMALAMMLDSSIYADWRFVQPWFGVYRFRMNWNDSAACDDLPQMLSRLTDEAHTSSIGALSHAAWDALPAPDRIAKCVLGAAGA